VEGRENLKKEKRRLYPDIAVRGQREGEMVRVGLISYNTEVKSTRPKDRLREVMHVISDARAISF